MRILLAAMILVVGCGPGRTNQDFLDRAAAEPGAVKTSSGLVYQDQGRSEEAEQLCLRALEGREERLGPKQTVQNLANVYQD